MRNRITPVIYIIVIALMIILQTSFFPQFILTKIKPDLVLLFVMSTGLLKGYKEGVYTGILAGFLSGIICGNLWGLYIIGYGLTGFISGVVPEKMETDAFLVPLILGILSSLGFMGVFFVFSIFFDIIPVSITDLQRIPVFLFWNSIFCLPVFFLCKNFLLTPGRELDLTGSTSRSNYLIE